MEVRRVVAGVGGLDHDVQRRVVNVVLAHGQALPVFDTLAELAVRPGQRTEKPEPYRRHGGLSGCGANRLARGRVAGRRDDGGPAAPPGIASGRGEDGQGQQEHRHPPG